MHSLNNSSATLLDIGFQPRLIDPCAVVDPILAPGCESPTSAREQSDLAAAIAANGFARTGRGWHRGDHELQLNAGWIELACHPETAPGLGKHARGLWKPIDGRRGTQLVFELPLAALAGAAADAHDPDALASVVGEAIAWASATLGGTPPAGWEPPAPETIDGWIGARGLTVRAGAVVRQGTVDVAADRLVLRMPLLTAVDPRLAGARRRWLEIALDEAQRQSRLVRCVLGATPGQAGAEARVDLSGVPPGWSEIMILTARDSLRWVGGRLIEVLQVVADGSTPSELLDVEPRTPWHP
jgi:hypothetical protein